jgi:hypothetical protein
MPWLLYDALSSLRQQSRQTILQPLFSETVASSTVKGLLFQSPYTPRQQSPVAETAALKVSLHNWKGEDNIHFVKVM